MFNRLTQRLGRFAFDGGCLPKKYSRGPTWCSSVVVLFILGGCNYDNEVRPPGGPIPEECIDGEYACLDNDVVICKADEWNFVEACDESSGEACSQGACYYPCEKAKEDKTSVGCEYYAAVLPDIITVKHDQYSLVISNTNDIDAMVTIEGNDAQYGEAAITTVLDTLIVPADSAVTVYLESRKPLSLDDTFGCGSYLAATPYHIVSNVPVIIYQFSPDNMNTDASLLLAVQSLGKKYMTLSYPQILHGGSSFMSIIATQDDTTVTVVPMDKVQRSNTQGPVPISASDPFEELVFKLNKGEILTLEGVRNNLKEGIGESFTGSTISADAPIAVFAGTDAGQVPNDICCNDHMEEQMLPEKTLGREFVAARTPIKSINDYKEPEYWLVLGTVDGTTVTTSLDPPQDKALLNRGEMVEFKDTGDFMVWSDQPVMLGQFVAGNSSPNVRVGDPSYVLVPPIEQFLDHYITMVPYTTFSDQRIVTIEENYLIITVPSNATFTLDNLPPSSQDCEFTEVTSDWTVYRCLVDKGRHEIQASNPVGLIVYGVNNYSSYGHSGGLNMQEINPVEVE